MRLSKTKRIKPEYFWGYVFISLPILGFMLFGMIPLVFSLVVSFSEYDFFGPMNFTGLKNFIDLFSDSMFLKSLGNNLLALTGVPLQLAVAMTVAFFLTREIKCQPLFRTMFFIPSLCSSVAITLVWKWVYNTEFGVLNSILGIFGIPNINWLGNKNIVMLSMILQGIWIGIGGGMVMYIAAIKGVPGRLYEAAKIDGAGSAQQFFKITLPLTTPTTFYLLVTSVMACLQDFARYKLMTDGGPNGASTTTVLYVYKAAFQYIDFGYGYATAMAWILGLFIIILIGIIFASSKRWVHYND